MARAMYPDSDYQATAYNYIKYTTHKKEDTQ